MYTNYSDYAYISHSGVKGMRWGVRKYQNRDGTLTEEGKRRYGSVENFEADVHRRENIKKAAVIGAVAVAGIYLIARSHAGRDVMNKGGNAVSDALKSNPKVTPEAAQKGAEAIQKIHTVKAPALNSAKITKDSISSMKTVAQNGKSIHMVNGHKVVKTVSNTAGKVTEHKKSSLGKSIGKALSKKPSYKVDTNKVQSFTKTAGGNLKKMKKQVSKSNSAIKKSKSTFKNLDALNKSLLKKGVI